MTTKTESELRALDAWICQHVFQWRKVAMLDLGKHGLYAVRKDGVYIHDRGSYVKNFHPTTDPAAAMMVLEKCLTKTPVEIMSPQDNWFCVSAASGFNQLTAEHGETLPLAICLFAKALFGKEK